MTTVYPLKTVLVFYITGQVREKEGHYVWAGVMNLAMHGDKKAWKRFETEHGRGRQQQRARDQDFR